MKFLNPEVAKVITYIRDACAMEDWPDITEIALDGPADPNTPGPVWERKPLHQMSEQELMDTIAQMENEDYLHDEMEIRKQADAMAYRWEASRNDPNAFRLQEFAVLDRDKSMGGYVSTQGVYPAHLSMTTRRITVNLPPWLRDVDQARWVAERQIREQWEDHR